MIWATVSSWSCFCWLYRASPSLAAKNIINMISVLTSWWCPCVESSLLLLEEGVCYDQWVLLPELLLGFQMFKLFLEKAEEPEIRLPTSAGSWKKRVPEKHLFLLYWLCQSLWLCGSQYTVENSERDRNTRQPDLSLEKPICRSGSNS